MSRFYGAPENLLGQALHHLDDETRDVIVVIAKVQSATGRRWSAEDVRGLCEFAGVAPNPVLRALGWGPGDRDMLAGRITQKVEDMPETAGTALCWMARVGASGCVGKADWPTSSQHIGNGPGAAERSHAGYALHKIMKSREVDTGGSNVH